MIHFDLDHYFARSTEWFNFLCAHPQYITKRIVRKLYNKYMLTAMHTYILSQNFANN